MRSIRVALVVGTVLVLINQGDALLRGQITSASLARIALTYCVPYAVATYASVMAIRAKSPAERD